MQMLHVAIGFVGKTVAVDTIQTSFGSGAGWARYAPNCWLVYTNETTEQVARRVRALCSENDSIFVTGVDTANNFGWLQKEIWDWLKARV